MHFTIAFEKNVSFVHRFVEKAQMLSELAVGDTVLTTSGFYGVIIDITDDTVIVEFGSNRNCRIPMQKSAVALVEKPEDAQ